MMGDQLQSVPDSELFSVETEYKSDEDSDYTDSDVTSQSSCDEIEDGFHLCVTNVTKFSKRWVGTRNICKLGFTMHLQ